MRKIRTSEEINSAKIKVISDVNNGMTLIDAFRKNNIKPCGDSYVWARKNNLINRSKKEYKNIEYKPGLISELIRLRENRNILKNDLSKLFGMYTCYVSKLELKNKYITKGILEKYIKYFNLSFDYFDKWLSAPLYNSATAILDCTKLPDECKIIGIQKDRTSIIISECTEYLNGKSFKKNNVIMDKFIDGAISIISIGTTILKFLK